MNWEQDILRKIDNGEKLSKTEIQELIWDYEISKEVGDNRRWTRSVTSIVEIYGRTFCIEWEEGLTECQENEYWNQPYEVEKFEYFKTIKVTEWKRKDSNE